MRNTPENGRYELTNAAPFSGFPLPCISRFIIFSNRIGNSKNTPQVKLLKPIGKYTGKNIHWYILYSKTPEFRPLNTVTPCPPEYRAIILTPFFRCSVKPSIPAPRKPCHFHTRLEARYCIFTEYIYTKPQGPL